MNLQDLEFVDGNEADCPNILISLPKKQPYFEIDLSEYLLTVPETHEQSRILAFAATAIYKKAVSCLGKVTRARLSYYPQSMKMLLKIDPVVWYNDYIGEDKANATEYCISRMHKKERQYDVQQEIQVKKPAVCRFGKFDCNIPGCKLPHADNICVYMMKDYAKGPTLCSQYIMETMIIKIDDESISTDPRFLPCMSGDNFGPRDIVTFIQPAAYYMQGRKPFQWGTWKGHYENQELISSPAQWKYALDLRDTLNGFVAPLNIDVVEEIGFNIGRWESKMAADPFATECHGHCHHVLTIEGQNALVSSSIGKYVSGRFADPTDYDMEDAKDLYLSTIVPSSIKEIMNILKPEGKPSLYELMERMSSN